MKIFTGLISYYLKLNFSFGIPMIVKLVSKLIFFSIQVTLWGYVLQESRGNTVFSYFTFAAVVTSLISFNTDRVIQSKYENGSVVNYLIRPYHFYAVLLTEDLSRSVISFIFTGLPVLAVSSFLFDIYSSVSLLSIFYFFCSILLSMGLTWSIYLITGLSIVYFKNNEGIIQFRMFFVTLFSGSIIPIYLVPDPWKSIFYALPFYNMVDTPVSILISPVNSILPQKLLMQFIWFAVFLIFAIFVYRSSVEKIEIMGG